MSADPIVIVAFARTPMGGFQGALAGVSATAATHHPAATSVATPITPTCQTRRHQPVGAASR